MELDDRTREALVMRLDRRCIKWPFVLTGNERRCGECDGCIVSQWIAGLPEDERAAAEDRSGQLQSEVERLTAGLELALTPEWCNRPTGRNHLLHRLLAGEDVR